MKFKNNSDGDVSMDLSDGKMHHEGVTFLLKNPEYELIQGFIARHDNPQELVKYTWLTHGEKVYDAYRREHMTKDEFYNSFKSVEETKRSTNQEIVSLAQAIING